MSLLGNLSNFDYKTGEWSIFKARLTQFLKANSVKEENKSAILITHLTDESYRLVRNLAYPKVIDVLSFEELVKLLDGHFKPKQCSYGDKARFYGATRNIGEGLGDWAARLRGLASFCDFGNALETNLADRFVLGLGPGPEREKLFELNASSITLGEALKVAEKAESARDAKMAVTSTIKEEPIYRVSSEGGGRRGGSGSASRGGAAAASATTVGRRDDRQADVLRCAVCGMRNHDALKCRYKGYRCQKCGALGHLKKVCKFRGPRVNHIDGENSDNSAEMSCCEECRNFSLRYVSIKPIFIKLKLGTKLVTMELDSGSGTCVIADSMYLDLFSEYQLLPCKLRMCLYNGHKIIPLGYFTINATYNNQTKSINIFVVKNGGPGLLGRDFMSAFSIVFTTKINKICEDKDVDLLLEQYPNLWRDELGAFNKLKVTLELSEKASPKFFKPRPVPFALKEKVETELDRLVDLGILVPINHSQYATPIVPVLKENGKVRIAGDFSVTLNKDLVIDKYPLPRIEEVFAKLGGGEHYSKIDLKNAYNQILLSEASQELTTINTSKGLFKYTRLVYGLANAPAIFQKAMETLLAGIDGVSCWLDDICITGPDKTTHLSRLRDVLCRLNEAGLRLQKEKCELFKNSVTYLGYTINKDGLHASTEKVKAIINAPEPTNVTEVKRFLGVVNYYRNFIPNASSVLSPLHELLRSDAEWEWGERQRRAVRQVQRELASERALAHFEPDAQLVLAVDAGPSGLGAVLSQRDAVGRERPLAFGSRSLTSSERNYSQIQKEATAIIFGVKRFHQYLYGRSEPFILQTDHRPLVSIFNKKSGISITTALRLQRYAIILSAYNYIVQYTSSANNLVADYFSRAPLAETSCITDNEFDIFSSLKFLNAISPAVTSMNIKHETEKDTVLKTVVRYMQRGWPRKINCETIKPYFQCRTDLQLENGVLLRGHRVVIPSILRERMLKELHNTHLGIVKMKCNARSRMWWPGIDADIECYSAACATCISLRARPPREVPASWPRPPGAWNRVHFDYMSIGQRVYLVVVDAYSKWVDCLHMNNGTTTQALISKLTYLFSYFGIPNVLVSDNDVKINCAEFRLFCSNNGIKYLNSPIYHPNSNGQAENTVKNCKRMIRCILNENMSQQLLHDTLCGYLFEYRNTVHCTTDTTPAKLMFGRNLRSRLDLILPSDTKAHEQCSVPEHRRCFELGDRVWVRWYNARKESWELGILKEKVGNKMFKIYIDKNSSYCVRHMDQLLKYKGKNENGIPNINDVNERIPPAQPPSFPTLPESEPTDTCSTLEPSLINNETVGSSEPIPSVRNVELGEGEVWADCVGEEGSRPTSPPGSPQGTLSGLPSAVNLREPTVLAEPPIRRQLRPRKNINYKM